jgi:hypothetical protein
MSQYRLIAVIDRDDGAPSDTGAFELGEFASEAEAEEYACHLEVQAPEFALANPPPKPAPYRGEPAPKHRQRVLLTGMDCLPDQENLFDT